MFAGTLICIQFFYTIPLNEEIYIHFFFLNTHVEIAFLLNPRCIWFLLISFSGEGVLSNSNLQIKMNFKIYQTVFVNQKRKWVNLFIINPSSWSDGRAVSKLSHYYSLLLTTVGTPI